MRAVGRKLVKVRYALGRVSGSEELNPPYLDVLYESHHITRQQ